MISFDLSFNRNPYYNEEPLIKLLNMIAKNPRASIDEALLQNYQEFFDLICQFGVGMIIFPSLIFALEGSYSINLVSQSPNASAGHNNSVSESQSSKPPQPRIKINFKIPFKHADLQKKCFSPYFAFNPYKENVNGRNIYKSPLHKSRKFIVRLIYIGEYIQQVKDDMKKIMEQNKSPLS